MMKKFEESLQRIELKQVRSEKLIRETQGENTREAIRSKLIINHPLLEKASNLGSVLNSEVRFSE
jgi:hypothetical protein